MSHDDALLIAHTITSGFMGLGILLGGMILSATFFIRSKLDQLFGKKDAER